MKPREILYQCRATVCWRVIKINQYMDKKWNSWANSYIS